MTSYATATAADRGNVSKAIERAANLATTCSTDVYANAVKNQMKTLMGGAQGTINKYAEVMSYVVISTVFELLQAPGVGTKPAAISPTFNEVTLNNSQPLTYTDLTKAATVGFVKDHVHAAQEGLQVKDSVKYAVSIPSGESLDVSNVENMLTTKEHELDENALPITLEVDDRILIFQSNSTVPSQQSAIYVVQYSSDFGGNVLIDTYDITQTNPNTTYGDFYSSAFVFVESGWYANMGFVQTIEKATPELGLNWTQFTGAGSIQFGNNFVQSGNQVSLKPNVTLTGPGGVTGTSLTCETITCSNLGDGTTVQGTVSDALHVTNINDTNIDDIVVELFALDSGRVQGPTSGDALAGLIYNDDNKTVSLQSAEMSDVVEFFYSNNAYSSGDGIQITDNGTISVKVGDGIQITHPHGPISVKVGDGIQITDDGTISVKVGDGIQITDDGTISVTGGSSDTTALPTSFSRSPPSQITNTPVTVDDALTDIYAKLNILERYLRSMSNGIEVGTIDSGTGEVNPTTSFPSFYTT